MKKILTFLTGVLLAILMLPCTVSYAAVLTPEEIAALGDNISERDRIDQLARLEARPLPADLDYDAIPVLRLEARQKFGRIRPATLGQASRISGVSPADMTALMIWLDAREKEAPRG